MAHNEGCSHTCDSLWSRFLSLEGLNSFLLDTDFRFLFVSSDVNYIWSSLRHIILTSISLFTPLVRTTTHKFPKWFTPEIRHRLHKVHSLRKRYRKTNSAVNFYRLVSAECPLQQDMLDARFAFENDFISNYASKRDPKIFRFLREISSSNKVPPILTLNSTSADNPLDIANLFNKFFYSTFSHSSLSTINPPHIIPDTNLSSIDISIHDTFMALCTIDPTKAKDGDGIYPLILHRAATPLSEPLHHLFLACLAQADIPTDWKCHYITPIPKSGDKCLITNYRSISLLSTVSKLFERLVFDKVYGFLYENALSRFYYQTITSSHTKHHSGI